jgi:hypothetical protein
VSTLLDTRFAEIAQWAQELGVGLYSGTGGEISVNMDQLRALGLADVVQGISPIDRAEVGNEAYQLVRLYLDGRISGAEAEAYLLQKYPDYNWSAGRWGDQGVQTIQEQVSDDIAGLDDGDPESPLDAAARVQEVAATAGGAGVVTTELAPVSQAAPLIDDMPEVYDSAEVQQSVGRATEQLSLQVEQLSRGQIRYPAHSIPGGALQPGTIPISAIQPGAFQDALNRMPGPDEAVLLDLIQSDGLDQWLENGGNTGPGRVRTVRGVRYPLNGWQPTSGPRRYRIINAGMEFTPLSTRLELATSPVNAPIVHTDFGMVIHRIPHSFRRPPQGILALAWVGDPPTPFAYSAPSLAGIWTTQVRLFHDRAKADFQDTVKTFASAIGIDTALDPGATTLGGATGFSVTLVSGETTDEVYEQLNSRECAEGARFATSGPGPTATTREGLTARGAAPPGVLLWNGSTVTPNYTHIDESSAGLASNGRIVQGIPFRYEDCQKMRANDTHFDLVVHLHIDQSWQIPNGGSFAAPSEWSQHGVRLAGGDDRVWGVDVIVF